MAFNADGSDFVGLDSDIFGDGDADTQALDVYLQQRLRGNQYYLNQNRRSVSRAFFSTSTAEDATTFNGERAFATIQPGDFVTIPIKLLRGLETVTIGGLAHVQTQNSGTDGVLYWLLVRDAFRNTIGIASGELAIMSGGYEIPEIVCTLDRPYADAEAIGEVLLRIQSQDAGDSASNINDVANTQGLRWTANTAGYIANQTTSPSSSSPEQFYLQQDVSGALVDIFGVDDGGGKTAADVVFPDRSLENSTALSSVFSLRHMSHIQVRSLWVQLGYEEDRFGRIGLGDLQAKQTVKGPLAITQAEAINQLNRSPRLLSWGPGDFTDSRQQSSWPTNYHMKWPIAHGDASSHVIIDDTFMGINTNPTFEVIAYVIPTVDIAGGVDVGGVGLVKGKASWVFDIDVEQFDTADSDWSTPTSIGSLSSDTRELGLFTTDWPEARYLRTKTIMHDWSGSTGSFIAGNASSDFNLWQFACKEGILFEEDYRLIQVVRFRVEAALAYSDTLTPVRFRLSAAYDDGTAEHPALGNVSAASTLDESLHLTLVGYSVWEV